MYPGEFTQGCRVGVTVRQKPDNPDLGIEQHQPNPSLRRAACAQHTLPHRHTLKREISVALVAKLVLLTALWFIFFSHPLDRSLGANDMDRVLLGPVAQQPLGKTSSPAGIIPKESRHDP